MTLSMTNTYISAASGSSSKPLTSTDGNPPGHLPEENVPADLTSFSTLADGHLRGNVSAASLANTYVPASLTSNCSNYDISHTMLDLVVGGCSVSVISIVKPTQPDTSDPLGDVYAFQMNSTTHRVSGCTKNGSAGTLSDCLAHAAYSAYFTFTADRVIGEPRHTWPHAPTDATAVRSDQAATVSWTAPSSDGGTPITAYTVTASPGGQTCSWSSGPLSCTVTGLTNGTAYTFTVTATNDVGTGPASTPSSSVTPAGAPAAPTAVHAAPGDAAADVSWAAADPNGSAVTAYTVASSPGAKTCTTTGATGCTVTGLTNGTPYTFTVTATNDVGTGTPSAPSASVTPGAPTAPTGVVATAGDGLAQVSWTAAQPNGSPVTGYTATSAPGSHSCTTTGATGCTVTGLTNGTSYTFTVTATNAIATGPASAASAPVTPGDHDAPTAAIGSGPPTLTTSRSASFSFTGTDPNHPDATLTFTCRIDGGPLQPCTTPQSYASLTDGSHTFGVVAADEAQNQSAEVTDIWQVDGTGPTVTPGALPVFTLANHVRLSYAGADGGSGVATYDVRYRRAAYGGGFGAYVYPNTTASDWQDVTATSVTLPVGKGYTYCLSARARDVAGNLGTWSAERCTAVALDDRSLATSSGWKRGTGNAFYAGTMTTTTKKGVKLTRTGVTGRRIAIVASRLRGGGTIGVYWNGALVKKLSLARASTTNRQVITVATFSGVRSGTLTIKTLTTGTVRVDGLVVNRT
jgi:hypothetical protein